MARVIHQKSCGIVPAYVPEDGVVRFLLLNSGLVRNPRATWEFPKGAVEAGENEIQTARRECREETGLVHLRLVPDFRALDTYTFRREGTVIQKRVVYFLALVADPSEMKPEPDGREHIADERGRWYRWLDFDDARGVLYHHGQRALLASAWAHLKALGYDRREAAAKLPVRPLVCESSG